MVLKTASIVLAITLTSTAIYAANVINLRDNPHALSTFAEAFPYAQSLMVTASLGSTRNY
jgi:hypothetical protein